MHAKSADVEGKGALGSVELIYPNGRKRKFSLEFPSLFAGSRQWVGLNVCECGGEIHYAWEETHTTRSATCSACGVIFILTRQ